MESPEFPQEYIAEAHALQDLAFAPSWRRVAAIAVDGAVFLLTLWLAILIWEWSLPFQFDFRVFPGGGVALNVPDQRVFFVTVLVVAALFGPIYFGFQESGRRSASWGKRLFSIKVVRLDASRLGYWRSALRAFLHALPGVGVAGDLLQPFTKRRQALHDVLTNSIVIRAEGLWEETLLGNLKKLLRYLLKCFLYVAVTLFGIAIVSLLVLVAINWKDEALRPEVNEALHWTPSTTAFSENGYLVLVGQNAAPDEDPVGAGRTILQSQLKESEKQGRSDSLRVEEPANVAPATVVTSFLCDYKKQNCVDHYLNTRSKLTAVLSQASTLEKRFGLMVASRRFEVVASPAETFAGPNWRYLTDGSELVRAKALFDLADGRHKEGIQRFVNNAEFSRRLLAQSTTISGRKIAIGMVHRDLRFASEMLLKYPQLVNKYSAYLQQLTVSVTSPDFTLERSLAHERARVLSQIRKIWNSPDRRWFTPFVMWLLAQPNATENLIFTEFDSYIQLARVSADAYDAEVDKTGLMLKAASKFGYWANFYPKNPIGEILSRSTFSSNNYFADIEKQHDLNGHIRLVALQLKLASNTTPRISIPSALRNLPEGFSDPYTQEPMLWDEVSSELRFRGRQNSNQNLKGSSLYSVRVLNLP